MVSRCCRHRAGKFCFIRRCFSQQLQSQFIAIAQNKKTSEKITFIDIMGDFKQAISIFAPYKLKINIVHQRIVNPQIHLCNKITSAK